MHTTLSDWTSWEGGVDLFAATEPFWRAHIDLFLRVQHAVGGAAAIAVAATNAPPADWLPLARLQLERRRAVAPASAP